VRALALGAGVALVGGDFTSVGGQTRNYIAQLSLATGLATPWNPGANSFVHALLLSGSTLYVGGQFSNFGGQALGGQSVAYLAAVDTSGVVSTWNPFINGQVRSLAVADGKLYLAGDFMNLHSGSAQRSRLAAIDVASGTATSWNPSASASVRHLRIHGRTVYAAGPFARVSGQPQAYIAAIEDPAITGLPAAVLAPAGFAFTCAPNPARQGAALRFLLPHAATVTVRLFDIQGREVARPLDRARCAAGLHEGQIEVASLASGVYFLRLEAGTGIVTRRLAVAR
jgi:hypothetical protein